MEITLFLMGKKRFFCGHFQQLTVKLPEGNFVGGSQHHSPKWGHINPADMERTNKKQLNILGQNT